MMSAAARIAAVAVGLAALGAGAPAVGRGQEESSMATDIWTATDDQLTSGQAKITYLAEQDKPIPTIVFAAEGHAVSMVRFVDVQRSKRPYTNDELPYTETFFVPRQDLRRILTAVRPVVAVAAEGPAFLSFTVLTGAGANIVGGEFFVPQAKGRAFFDALRASIPLSNVAAHAILGAQQKNLFP
jgi:hypothetical protein